MKSARRVALLLVTASLSTGCEEENLAVVRGVLQAPEVLDFGDVQVGMTAALELELSNEGAASISIEAFEGEGLSGSQFRFTVPREGLRVTAGETEAVPVTFQPFVISDAAFEVDVTITVQGRDPHVVTLRGRGVGHGLEIEPNPLDFGLVLAGASRTLEVTLTNRLAIPVDLRSAEHFAGVPETTAISGSGSFTVDVAADNRGLLVDAAPLAPGASVTVPITYAPDPSNLLASDRAQWGISNCDFDLCRTDLELRGGGTTAAIVCAPEAVDFGAVNPGTTLTTTVTCTNVAADTVTVDFWQLEAGASPELTLATPDTRTELAPGEGVDIDVAFSPTQTTWETAATPTATLLVGSTHPAGGRLDPVRVPLLGRAGGPLILVSPASLYFGEIAVGTHHERRLLVENRGLEPLDVTAIDPDTAGTGAFSVDFTTLQLQPGESAAVTVRYAPPAVGAFSSAVRFVSNDSATPRLDVPVGGTAVELPPCQYNVSPVRVNFGAVPFTQIATEIVRIENTGQDACLINDLEIVPPAINATTAFTLVDGPQTGLTLAAGATLDVPIDYNPTSPGGDRSDLGFYISDPNGPNPRVPLTGVGEALLQVECPPPVTTQAGVPVRLTANAASFGSTVASYAWALTNFPNGGNGTPNQWNPSPPSTQAVDFLPYIVGVYDVQVTVLDNAGRMASCTTQVTAEGEGLQVTMTWNGTGDVDLHVHNDTQTAAWFTNEDCYYSNRTPLWDAAFGASTGPNPELDFDNTSANGPENTRVLVPEVGAAYTIAAHNYSRSAGRLVTIEIFCGGVLPQATFTSRALVGADSGNCSNNDFWKVAQVIFTSQNTCTIVPIDTYGPSSAACTAF